MLAHLVRYKSVTNRVNWSASRRVFLEFLFSLPILYYINQPHIKPRPIIDPYLCWIGCCCTCTFICVLSLSLSSASSASLSLEGVSLLSSFNQSPFEFQKINTISRIQTAFQFYIRKLPILLFQVNIALFNDEIIISLNARSNTFIFSLFYHK